ncbi:glycosyltransferase family 39 protein [Fundidesulfovibrio putealis]|uniref:glycosyltransferase family 39 protein n=1 Tax=Fundidesulfovibrio putealis TaxID=270496 RepID=UPI000481982A|nr:glycosyltransferase family 39 protein [Fundidesulfovibrio putealis]
MSHSRARIILLAIVVCVAAALRLAWLESIPLWWDEFVTLGRARLPLGELWQSLSFQGPSDSSLDSSPPLLHAIVHYALELGSATETWVKLPSAVFGTLTVLVLYPLGTRLYRGRAGLFASALLALSLYHIHYSREARPYSLYLLLGVTSLWLLLRALEKNRFPDWAAYALAAAATLYSSYLGGASLAAQAGYVLMLGLARQLPARTFLAALGAFAATALAYAPWLPGHLFHMQLIASPGEGMGLSFEVLRRAMLEYSAQGTLYLACAGLGLAVGIPRNPKGTALLLLWTCLSLAAVLLMRTGITDTPRALLNFVPGLALLAGAGIDMLVRGVSLALPDRAAALLGLAAAVAVSLPGLAGPGSLAEYYRRDQHSVRDDLLAVAEAKTNIDALAFPRNRHLKMFTRWYLPGVFDDLSSSDAVPYRRVLLLAGQDFTPPGLGNPETFGDLSGYRLGLVNLSPLDCAGPWRADFSGMDFYREAERFNNIGPDLFQKTLSLYNPNRPGLALWRFTAPIGGFKADVPLRCRLRLSRSKATPAPDASAMILAGNGPDTLTELARVTQADFPPDALVGETEISLAIPNPGDSDLFLAVALEPGTVHGNLEPVSLEIDLPPDGAAARHVLKAERIKARLNIATWTPGLVRAGDDALYAFAPDDPALADFLAAHPGIAPVAELPGFILFDPALARPLLDVPGPEFLFTPGTVQGVSVSGRFAGQTVALGDAALRLPTAPDGSLLRLAPSGAGRLRTVMDFTGPVSWDRQVFTQFNVEKSASEPYLSCKGENSCFVVYALESPAPIRAVRMVYSPEAYGEPGQTNGARLSLSTDGNTYRELDSFSVSGSELWEGGKRRVAWVTLKEPAQRVYLRLELTSDKARLRAAPGSPMRLDAWLDPVPLLAGKLPLVLPAKPLRGASTGDPVSVSLSPEPLPDLDRLLAPH